MLKKTGKTQKKWVLRDAVTANTEPAVGEIASALGIGKVTARLLYNRGYTTKESAAAFLRLESEMLCDPFLLDGMREGIDRVRRPVERASYGE